MPSSTPRAEEQLNLFSRTAEELSLFLEKISGKPLILSITENTHSLISVKWQGKKTRVRISSVFLQAGYPVLAEIGKLIAHGSTIPTPLVRRFIRENITPKITDKVLPCTTKGKFFDLQELFNAFNESYFANRITASISWGRQQKRQGRTLGSYDHTRQRIIISRHLDKSSVPRYAVEYVIFHEMLHADIGIAVKNGRRVLHSPDFREREKGYKKYAEARKYFGDK
ncbi:MAG: SprT-like domain-containing protein [Deltaproteobacteria bacterium]|nr:SprT-like domain-containing protein [Deltaproteobacteria bacterium]